MGARPETSSDRPILVLTPDPEAAPGTDRADDGVSQAVPVQLDQRAHRQARGSLRGCPGPRPPDASRPLRAIARAGEELDVGG